jgi:AcrR family transcriptional regulator
MSEYSSSRKTKTALINAAGELFADCGVKAVTTRAIAKKAGENIGNIHYHFGGKDGLLDAVVDYALEIWEGNPLETFFNENEKMLETKKGQIAFVRRLMKLFCEVFFFSDRPSWCSSLVFQVLQRDFGARKNIMEKAAFPNTRAFMNLYEKIKGSSDHDKAHCWALSVMAPLVLYSINPFPVEVIRNSEDKDLFIKELCETVTENALLSLELKEES